MRTLLLSMTLFTWLAATAHAAQPLRVMTFNIRGDFDEGRATDKPEAWNSRSGTHRRDRVLPLITEVDPDLLGVQEAYHNQVVDLRQALPEHEFYGVGRDDGLRKGEYSGIFYRRERFEKLDVGTFWLSNSPDEAGSQFPDAACVRIASWLILVDRMVDRREILVLNTHWDHVSQPARLHSARLIHDRLARLADGRPTIVMGDFNAGEENEALQVLTAAADARMLTDSYRQVFPTRAEDEATFHGFRGGTRGSRIDFILTSGQLRATAAQIVRTDYDGVYPSDHYPVTVTLERKQ